MKNRVKHIVISLVLVSSLAPSMQAQEKDIDDLPSYLSIDEGDNNSIYLRGFAKSIKMQGPGFFDWDWGTLTAYGAQAGEYEPTFSNEKNEKKVVKIVVNAKAAKEKAKAQETTQEISKSSRAVFVSEVRGDSIEDIPDEITIKAEGDETVLLRYFPDDIRMEQSDLFEWSEGSLVAYDNLQAGEHELTFTDKNNQKKVMKVLAVDKIKEVGKSRTISRKIATKGNTIEVYPGESIEAAIKTASAGDKVLVHGGVYDEKIDVEHIFGNQKEWIKISNYPGEKPILFTSDTGKVFNLEKCAFVQVNGFTIKEPKGVGIRVFNSHHIIVSNNEVYGLGKRGNPGGGAHAIVADGRKDRTSHDILITGNYLHDNLTRFDAFGNKTDDETLTMKGAVSYSTIENNRVEDNQFIGIDIIGPEKDDWGHSHHNVIRNNYVARNGGKYGDAIYIDGGANHIVEHNLVEFNRGSGISAGQEHGGEMLRNITIRNNAIKNQQENQFYLGDTSNSTSDISNILFEENYVYASSAADNAHIGVGAGTDLQMKNNYFELSGSDIIRKVYDAGSPNMSSNALKNNSYNTDYAKSEIEGLGWGDVRGGHVEANEAIKHKAGADMSRIPEADSNAVLGDRELTYTRVKEAGQRIDF